MFAFYSVFQSQFQFHIAIQTYRISNMNTLFSKYLKSTMKLRFHPFDIRMVVYFIYTKWFYFCFYSFRFQQILNKWDDQFETFVSYEDGYVNNSLFVYSKKWSNDVALRQTKSHSRYEYTKQAL